MSTPILSFSTPTPRTLLKETRYGPLALAVVMFLLVFGVEIFDFGISIDEEVATYHADRGLTWLQQGRWGMALVTLALPSFEAIPLLSTLLLGAGLVFATWRAFSDFSLTRTQSYLFAAVHVGFPVWLHIAQFSTLAAGFGFGIAAAALGAGAAASGRKMGVVMGALWIGFATSVYQTLCVYSLVYILYCLHASFQRSAQEQGNTSNALLKQIPLILLSALSWFAGLAVYWAGQKLALLMTSNGMTNYLDSFIGINALLADPSKVASSTFYYLISLFLGTHPTYLGWGAGVLFLSWIGLFPPSRVVTHLRDRSLYVDWLSVWVVTVLTITAVAAPVLLSAASLPLRAQVAVPLLAAWLASRCGNSLLERFPMALWGVIGYFGVIVTSIGSSLFYTDQIVRKSDSALTQRLIPAIEKAAGGANRGREISISLIGERSFKFGGQFKRAELFGASFYDHDAGNSTRVALYMRLQGFNGLQPVWLGLRPELIPEARRMPIWPAEGSVKMVNGVVLIKLGRPTRQQLSSPF